MPSAPGPTECYHPKTRDIAISTQTGDLRHHTFAAGAECCRTRGLADAMCSRGCLLVTRSARRRDPRDQVDLAAELDGAVARALDFLLLEADQHAGR